MVKPAERSFATPYGPGRIVVYGASQPKMGLVLGHGAGSGIATPLMGVLSSQLRSHGISVVLIEQPWVAAGRKVAPAPAVLDECWSLGIDQLRLRTPVVLGGHSAGARVACRTARQLGAVGVVALSFPLRPPGKPVEASRLPELDNAGLPVLVLQGTRDPFGGPSEFPAGRRRRLIAVPGGDHGLRTPARPAAGEFYQEHANLLIVNSIAAWIEQARQPGGPA